MLQRSGRNRRRSSLDPYASIIQATILWIDTYAAVEGQPCASSSKMSTASSRESAEPPTSPATYMPPKPTLAPSLLPSMRKTSSSSHWRANGIIAVRAKARAVCCIARCSSLSSKSIVATDNNSAIERQSTKGIWLMVDHIGHRCRNRLRRLVDVLHDCLHRIAGNRINLQLHLFGFSEKGRILHGIHERFA